MKNYIQKQLGKPSNNLMQLMIEATNFPTNLLVARKVVKKSPSRVLEIGFLRGQALERIAKFLLQAQVFGIEISEENLAAAKNRLAKPIISGQVHLQTYDGDVMPYKNDSFDLIYAVHVSYFWEDLDKQIREIFRILSSGGEVMLVMMSEHRLRRYDDKHFHKYSTNDIRQSMIKAGFQSEDIFVETIKPILNGKMSVISASKKS